MKFNIRVQKRKDKSFPYTTIQNNICKRNDETHYLVNIIMKINSTKKHQWIRVNKSLMRKEIYTESQSATSQNIL